MPLLGGSSLLDINQVWMVVGAKKAAEFLLRAAKFQWSFVLVLALAFWFLFLFFEKCSCEHWKDECLKVEAVLDLKEKLLLLRYASFRQLQSHDRSRSL